MRVLSFILIAFVLFCSCETDKDAEVLPPIDKPLIEDPHKYISQEAVRELSQFSFENHSFLNQETDFALRFFKQASREYSDGNLFFSPYSLACALGMLYNGAEGETKKEIAAVLGMSDYSPEQLNEYFQILTNALLAVDAQTDLSVVNAIWSDISFPVKKNFTELAKTYYDAEVSTLNFSLPSSLKAINDWCNEKTKGTIPKVLDELQPPIVLANAVYFKSAWTVPFEKSKTTAKPFHNQNGSTSTVQMMHQKELTLNYTHTADYEFVRLPYAGGIFSMNILLPKEGVDIEEIVQSMDGPAWESLTGAMWETAYVTLSMPRFTLEGNYLLSSILNAMGMSHAFGDADFSAMLEVSTSIGDILQKSYVNVNEEGTEASADTVIASQTLGGDPPPPPPRVTMAIDRPFIFAITDQYTNTILFMGKVTKL